MKPLRTLDAHYVVLVDNDVDTDQIIPARYLKSTTRSGLAKGLFADWRYDENGQERPDFVLNRPEAAGAQVLVAGNNFGCGSSREHAAWSLLEYGFRAVVSTGIADIFGANALKNGLLPIVVHPEIHRRLAARQTGRVIIDLERQTLSSDDDISIEFSIDPFARYCLLNGIDELGLLLSQSEAINRYESLSGGRRSPVS